MRVLPCLGERTAEAEAQESARFEKNRSRGGFAGQVRESGGKLGTDWESLQFAHPLRRQGSHLDVRNETVNRVVMELVVGEPFLVQLLAPP